jgi:hypothetical protein
MTGKPETTPKPLAFFRRASVQPPPTHKWKPCPEDGPGWRMCVRCCLMQQAGEYHSTKRYTVPECQA